ncbi:hypothetical protein DSL72_001126 [Monilinia vaccinii-corymbosi]|uniref:Uncharacterized protein n=1 Tax=Monilinia vaccinii-corymbosi TaxID=61207 RepID=A0A8A3P9X8_9HELO|nr:hypothetical protein DSL72_001126 [Monilinia vaccinii-corymbosi]
MARIEMMDEKNGRMPAEVTRILKDMLQCRWIWMLMQLVWLERVASGLGVSHSPQSETSRRSRNIDVSLFRELADEPWWLSALVEGRRSITRQYYCIFFQEAHCVVGDHHHRTCRPRLASFASEKPPRENTPRWARSDGRPSEDSELVWTTIPRPIREATKVSEVPETFTYGLLTIWMKEVKNRSLGRKNGTCCTSEKVGDLVGPWEKD